MTSDAGGGSPGGGSSPDERLGRLLDEISDRQARREERVLLTPEGSPWPTGQQGLEALATVMRGTARLS